jgi:hypothetical protein
MRLHEWFYDLICEICYDREYVYASYVRHFSRFMAEVMQTGTVSQTGSYEIPGLKSDLKARLDWKLERPVHLMGLNVVLIECTVESTRTGKTELRQSGAFELSTGESVLNE